MLSQLIDALAPLHDYSVLGQHFPMSPDESVPAGVNRFTDEEVREYKQLYQDEFDEVITDDEARDIMLRVVLLYEALLKPLPDEYSRRSSHDAMDHMSE